jgi:hypothetical protein
MYCWKRNISERLIGEHKWFYKDNCPYKNDFLKFSGYLYTLKMNRLIILACFVNNVYAMTHHYVYQLKEHLGDKCVYSVYTESLAYEGEITTRCSRNTSSCTGVYGLVILLILAVIGMAVYMKSSKRVHRKMSDDMV